MTELENLQRDRFCFSDRPVSVSVIAQQFILDNLDSIITINEAPRYENQGKPRSPEEDARLRSAYSAGADAKALSDELKRSRGAIRSRLKLHGLMV